MTAGEGAGPAPNIGEGDLYDRDALAWAEQQAALLQRLAAGERVDAEIDWAHVVEEVGDVGRSQLNAVESLWQQAMLHLLKLHLLPESEAAEHWRDEVWVFLSDADRRFAPSMRQRLDLQDVYRRALLRSGAFRERGARGEVPSRCPWTLDELLGSDVEALLAVLRRV